MSSHQERQAQAASRAAEILRTTVREYREQYVSEDELTYQIWEQGNNLGFALANQRNSSTPFNAFGPDFGVTTDDGLTLDLRS